MRHQNVIANQLLRSNRFTRVPDRSRLGEIPGREVCADYDAIGHVLLAILCQVRSGLQVVAKHRPSALRPVLTHDADCAGLTPACAGSAYLRLLKSGPLGAVAQRAALDVTLAKRENYVYSETRKICNASAKGGRKFVSMSSCCASVSRCGLDGSEGLIE